MIRAELKQLADKENTLFAIVNGAQKLSDELANRLRSEGYTVTEHDGPDMSVIQEYLSHRAEVATKGGNKKEATVDEKVVLGRIEKFTEHIFREKPNFFLPNYTEPHQRTYASSAFLRLALAEHEQGGQAQRLSMTLPQEFDIDDLVATVERARACRLFAHDFDVVIYDLVDGVGDQYDEVANAYAQLVQEVEMMVTLYNQIKEEGLEEQLTKAMMSKLGQFYLRARIAGKGFIGHHAREVYEELAWKTEKAYALLFGENAAKKTLLKDELNKQDAQAFFDASNSADAYEKFKGSKMDFLRSQDTYLLGSQGLTIQIETNNREVLESRALYIMKENGKYNVLDQAAQVVTKRVDNKPFPCVVVSSNHSYHKTFSTRMELMQHLQKEKAEGRTLVWVENKPGHEGYTLKDKRNFGVVAYAIEQEKARLRQAQ